MAAAPCLILYGNSVFLAGIKAQLERDTDTDYDGGLELVAVEAGRADAVELIRAHDPRALLFDLGVTLPGFLLELLREQPGMLLVGVDASSDKLLLLSARARPALSIADLIAVIKKGDPVVKSAALYGKGGLG